MSKPPLDLHAELVTPDGNTFRWGSEKRNAQDIPKGISFASKRFEGFERCSLNLARDTRGEYPDLGLFDGLNLIGYEGSTAYEGRIAQVPRSSPHQIDVEATGWMAHARDRKFTHVFLDRDLQSWEPAHAARKATFYGAGQSYVGPELTNDQAQARMDLIWEGLLYSEGGEAIYDAGLGNKLSRIQAGIAHVGLSSGDASYGASAAFWPTDNGGAGSENSGDLKATTNWSFTATIPKRFGVLQTSYAGAGAGTTNVRYGIRFGDVCVHGDDGLDRVPITGSNLTGVLASDVIAWIVGEACPKLNAAGVQATTWPIPHLVFKDRTDPYDAWLELNNYHLWELGVWEDRTLHYYPPDLTDYDWQVRSTDPGVSYTLQGDSTDHLANFAVVQFQNAYTGMQDTVSPDTHPELRDTSVENPANRWGIDKEFGVTLSVPTDPDGAAQIGRAALAENNQPKGAGTISFSGHIRDRAGNWQPGWKVRATDTIAIVDHPNDRPRMIVEAQWDHDSKRGTVGVDSTLNRVDAYLDRTATALKAGGL